MKPNMKRFLTLITLSILSLSLFGQYRVEESSQKRVPEWINSVQKDYLNISATGGSIEEAKEAVLSKIKQQITQSIATRVVSESNLSSSFTQNNDSYSKQQNVETTIMSKTAKLPFIGEISLAKADDYYWEKRYYKKEKRYEYFYAVRYPFSEFEMKSLVMEYQLHDKELDNRLEEFETGIGNITSIEEIGSAIARLGAFSAEFIKEDPRYTRVEGLINRYRNLYNNITIDSYQEKKGVIIVNLSLGTKEIYTAQKPILKSNCATQLSASFEGNTIIVRYNSENCYDDDENYIDIKFRAGNKYVSERVYIQSKVNVSLTGIISDLESGEPVPYAKITLIPSGKTATSARNGLYVFNDLESGSYAVQVMKKNYTTEEISTAVVAGKTTRADIAIERSPYYENEGSRREDPEETHEEIPATSTTTSIVTTAAPAEKDPVNCVRNGLSAYFRFNGSTRSEVSSIQGNPINSPQYISDSKDGTQAIAFSSLDESQIIFPKTMISVPLKSYSVTFWIKGISDGHLFSCTDGGNWYRSNIPMLKIENGKFLLSESSDAVFSHQSLDYNWHFIGLVVDGNDRNVTVSLFIDGVMIDSAALTGSRGAEIVKFLLCGKSNTNLNAIDTQIDNLRVYGSRALSEAEIAKIYMAEQ